MAKVNEERIAEVMPAELLEKLVTVMVMSLVDRPRDVTVKVAKDADGQIVLEVRVAQSDVGKVVGRNGRMASALRRVLAGASSLRKVYSVLDINGISLECRGSVDD